MDLAVFSEQSLCAGWDLWPNSYPSVYFVLPLEFHIMGVFVNRELLRFWVLPEAASPWRRFCWRSVEECFQNSSYSDISHIFPPVLHKVSQKPNARPVTPALIRVLRGSLTASFSSTVPRVSRQTNGRPWRGRYEVCRKLGRMQNKTGCYLNL